MGMIGGVCVCKLRVREEYTRSKTGAGIKKVEHEEDRKQTDKQIDQQRDLKTDRERERER